MQAKYYQSLSSAEKVTVAENFDYQCVQLQVFKQPGVNINVERYKQNIVIYPSDNARSRIS